MSGSTAASSRVSAPDDVAARESVAYRVRRCGVLDVAGADRVVFLQGQLTQDVNAMSPGEVRPAAGLTPKGRIVFLARVLVLPDSLRLLVPDDAREGILAHLKKYVIF